ncbi:hypothetical protein QR665_19010 [Acinetobacter gerneri]|uniref:phage tail fiber protein n=1 Tax=Acinetobacter gerneri TaxID=202952 RepID=UPI002935DAB7|nr:hypothetical protein [Acinetobacter gerneri]MDV2441534.1 hypothetical protein [Acinetobacter gerneri]
MAIQLPNLGTAPAGTGGDTSRSAMTKIINNFSTTTHAANRLVGTASGNVMEVGAFGVGATTAVVMTSDQFNNPKSSLNAGIYAYSSASETNTNLRYSAVLAMRYSASKAVLFGIQAYYTSPKIFFKTHKTDSLGDTYEATQFIYHDGNTTVDSNGFIKKASPVIKLFADKIEANEEALEQNPVFEKVNVGHYLIKNTEGFAKESWWIEVPTDSNGNRICAVQYQTLENGDIEVKTFKKKLNEEGEIVANLDHPIDIPNNSNNESRWIDIRLHSTPKPIVEKIPRTEKQSRMVRQMKFAPQLTYITKYEDLFDDAGNPVIVDGKNFQKPVTHIQTDKNGTPILTDQPVVNDKGETVFEWVQAVDSNGMPIYDDVPVLDADGNQIYDEVTYEPEQ